MPVRNFPGVWSPNSPLRCIANARVVTALCLAGLLLSSSLPTLAFDSDFEDGLGDWVVESAADRVAVVSGEGLEDFDIYQQLDLLVEPKQGQYMLALGEPKTRNETQNRGSNRVARHFVAASDNVAIALRLFSLDHRGDDTLRIALTRDSDGVAVVSDLPVFDFGNGNSCQAPCEQLIDVGKRKDIISTEWQQMSFSGLQPGESYTLRIDLEAGQNESLASWLYIDGVNLAPSATINFNPGSSGPAVEGDFVVFDCLQSVDPENSDLSCIWTADFPGVSSQTVIGNTVVYLFPEDGAGTVHLEVSDGENSATASTPIVVENHPPLVNALDVEVLPDGSVELRCRFVDAGAWDTHSVEFSVATGPLEVEHETVPALSSGLAVASFEAPSTPGLISASCDVVDDEGASGSDNFTIVVLPPADLDDRIAANTGSTQLSPQVISTDMSSLGGLAGPESVAVYEIRLPNGDTLPTGTEVSISARFPVDYDIVILSGSFDPAAATWNSAPFVSAPFVSAPFVSVPFVSAPFVSAPFVSAPFVSAPFVSAPFVSAPFVSAPFVSAPFVSAPFVSAPLTASLWYSPGFSLANFPLSQLAGAPDGSNISGIDVSFEDLGALGSGSLVNEPVFVKSLSAEFGTNLEQALVEIGPGENGLFVAVIPQAGSFSTAPYSLMVEAAVPPPAVDLLGAACDGAPLVDSSGSSVEVVRSFGDKTLIVTQKQRMMATFGMDEGDWQAWVTALEPFLGHDKVQATLLSVPAGIYDDADTHPCVVQKQNQVAADIKAVIDSHRTPDTEYVQLMGSLDIVPAYLLPDETQTGNEALFASDLLVQPGKPLAVAIAEGYMLTDAFYVDAQPQPFNGRLLYLEDISVSRLVETPAEILANAQRFVDSGGFINLLSVEAGTPGAGTQSTGYDFFIDGTEAINAILATDYPVSTVSLNNDTWDAAALRCQFFGIGEGCSKPVSAVNAVNAHMSYNGALTAKGFNCQYLPEQQPDGFCDGAPDPLGEVVLSAESALIYDAIDSDGFPLAINGVTFSIGCHSGLSVPDAWGLPEELNLPLDPARDWVQELGTWVGSYNFAYGDTDVADRGTEGIMPLVIARFAGGMTLGNALVKAKWQYGTGLFEFGVYDEKSLVGLNLFGMPQATLEGSISSDSIPSLAPVASAHPAPTGLELVIDYQELGSTNQASGSIDLHANARGSWYSIGGYAQGILGRPLLPVIKPFELRPIDRTSVHGVALRGGSYTVHLEVDPVFPAQTHDLVTEIAEPQPCVETLAPSLVASMNSFDSPKGLLQSFIVQPGQFQCDDTPTQQQAAGYQVDGDMRIWHYMNLELMHPATVPLDLDQQPPVVTRQDLLGNPLTGIVEATLDADDASGIREVIALVYRDDDGIPGGTGTAESYATSTRDGDGMFRLSLPDAFDNKLSFQYVDEAGNITAKTLKGALLQAIEVLIRTSIINAGGNTQIVVEIGDFDKLVAPYLTIDFGDGSPPLILELSDPSTYSIDAEGTATVVIEHDYTDLTEPSVTVKVEVRAAGALGTDEKVLTACSDPRGDTDIPEADIVGCAVSAEGTVLTIDVVLDAAVAPDVQYRLILPDTNTQIKYSDGAVTGPSKLKPAATLVDDNRISFEFNAARLGWSGSSPFQFLFETQDGVAGGAGQGFVDSTDIKIYQP